MYFFIICDSFSLFAFLFISFIWPRPWSALFYFFKRLRLFFFLQLFFNSIFLFLFFLFLTIWLLYFLRRWFFWFLRIRRRGPRRRYRRRIWRRFRRTRWWIRRRWRCGNCNIIIIYTIFWVFFNMSVFIIFNFRCFRTFCIVEFYI